MSNENSASAEGSSVLTPREYAARGGVVCPACGGSDVSGDSVEIDAGGASQSVSCDDCDATWVDVYKLTGYTDLEVPEQEEEEEEEEDSEAPDARLAEILVAQCGFATDAATYAAEVACRMAERHQALAARLLNGEGDTAQLEREIQDVEGNLRGLFGLKSADDAGVRGIKAIQFSRDARGPTVRIHFTEDTSNSFSGGWALGNA